MSPVLEHVGALTEDDSFKSAKEIITRSSDEALSRRYLPLCHSALFFAANRTNRRRKADEAKSLCELLIQRGIPLKDHDVLNQTALFYAARRGHVETIRYLMSKGLDPNVVDTNGETALFFAVRGNRIAAAQALLEGGANLEVVNNEGNTCLSLAPTAVFCPLQEERKKRRLYDDSGPGEKRQRTAMEVLRAWANEWPAREPIPRNEQVNYKQEDIIDEANGYVVLHTCPRECAAQVRVCEKNFVADHAQFLEEQPWFKDLSPQEWCKTVDVIEDESGVAVEAIKAVVTGERPYHFTLPLVEVNSGLVAGYIHAERKPKELAILQLKVKSPHMNQGLGKLLLAAAERHSQRIGWNHQSTYLHVLKANERAQRCYAKAGFKYESSRSAKWGKELHEASEWQKWKKVNKRAFNKKSPVAQ
ncbi:unnamed protein product [Cladocopium goreaui]|uniref:N-acetyltransferase domain-containing protein n=1 Tax=Cladocopium goreaui TaxID=2562237 RepID=A0A9P1C5D9_9DINO|nr:unnamed protein product [Cladocopium goreaui]